MMKEESRGKEDHVIRELVKK